MNKAILISVFMLLLGIAGCSGSNNNSDGTGQKVHPSDWLLVHGTQANADLGGCQSCHGFDFKGGGQAVSCFNCHASGPPFVGPHPATWNADPLSGHQANFQGTLSDKIPWTTCAVGACHGSKLEGGTAGPTCKNLACHASGTTGWPPRPHAVYTAGAVHGPAAKGVTDPALSMGNYCILCHGRPNNTFDGGFVSDPAIVGNAGGNCSLCHPDATAHPTNWVSSRPENTGVYHNDGTLADAVKSASCALCHTTTGATPASPFPGAPTCFSSSYNGLNCHPSGPGGAPHALPYTDPDLHGPAAKADLIYCQTCHATAGGAGSNPRFNLPKGNLPNGCETCHPVGSAHPTGSDRWTFNLDSSQPVRRTHFAAATAGTKACALCHNLNETNTGTGTAPGCNSCHLSITTFALNCAACHGTPPGNGTPNLTGAILVDHVTANGDVTAIASHEDCSICHGASEDGGQPGTLIAKSADYILFDSTNAPQGGDHLDGLIEANSAVGYQDVTASVPAKRFGCAAACHPNDTRHQLADSGLGTEAGNYTSGTVTCAECHGYPPNDTAAPGALSVNHLGSDGGATLLAMHGECQTCHGTKDSGFDSQNPLATYNPTTDHYNGQINMNSATGYNPVTRGCDNAVCHGNDANHQLPASSGLSVQFGDYGAGSCTSCHGYPPNGTDPLLTSAGTLPVDHLKLDNGATLLANHGDCQICHGTKDTGGAQDPVSPYNPATMHRDGKIQMNSNTAYNAISNGCDAAGCHVNNAEHQLSSSGLPIDLIALGAAGTCDSCHGGLTTDINPIATNAHSAHIASTTSVSLSCNICHGHSGSGPTHRNGIVDVPLNSGLASGGIYHPATKECSNLYCHGGTGTNANVPDWDAGTGGACGDCHGAPGTGRPDAVNEPSGGSHLSATHSIKTCSTCHPHDGVDTINHVNGPVNSSSDAQIVTAGEITLHGYGSSMATSPDPDGFKYSTSSCTTTCHGNAPWGGAGGCDFCHGYPPTSINNSHALGTVAVNHDQLRDGTGIGASLVSNHDECSTCHGVKQAGPGSGSMTPLSPTVLGGSYTYAEGIDHRDGNVTMNTGAGYSSVTGSCSTGACHGNDNNHSLGSGNAVQGRDFGPGSCAACHNSGTGGAPIVTSSSTHILTTSGGTFGDCTDCHSGHVGSGGVTIELPPANWSNLSGEAHVTGDMQTALGINYVRHNGINLGGPGTLTSISGKTSEAEICWACHDVNGIGELDNGGATYNFGRLADAESGGNHLSDWTSVDAWRQDAYAGVLTRPIASVHSVNMSGTVGHSSSVTSNVDGSGRVKRGSLNDLLPGNAAGQGSPSAVVLEDKKYIRCSYCHDVHSLNKAVNDTGTAAPYLRGSWLSDPYSADAPPNGDYNVSTNFFIAAQTNGMPRVKAGSIGSGYYIDQNSGNPTSGETLADSAGLCTLCHGSDVDNMDYYTSRSLWRTSNGHSNAVLGGTGSKAQNLFDARRGRTSFFMAMQDRIRASTNSSLLPWGPVLRRTKPDAVRNSGWYGGAVGATTAGGGYSSWYSLNGIGSHTGVTGDRAHEFSCSKCHSPHATGLPALLKTNCLDVQLGAWTNSNNSAVNYNADQSNNCHRKTATTDGWHNLAPKQ